VEEREHAVETPGMERWPYLTRYSVGYPPKISVKEKAKGLEKKKFSKKGRTKGDGGSHDAPRAEAAKL